MYPQLGIKNSSGSHLFGVILMATRPENTVQCTV